MNDAGEGALPRLEIEMTRRHLPGQNAEQLEIKLTASRSLAAQPVAHPAMAWAWLGLAPLAAWQAMWMALVPGAASIASQRAPSAIAVERDLPGIGAGASNVRPFPGPEQR